MALPLPLVPLGKEIQVLVLLIVQLQPSSEVTLSELTLAPELTIALVGEIANVQGALDWLKAKVLVAIVTKPVRIRPVGLLVTVKL